LTFAWIEAGSRAKLFMKRRVNLIFGIRFVVSILVQR
jgi:hypothetical protein